VLYFHLFPMFQTCTYLYSSNYSPLFQISKESIEQIFNRKSVSRNSTRRQSRKLILFYIATFLKRAWFSLHGYLNKNTLFGTLRTGFPLWNMSQWRHK